MPSDIKQVDRKIDDIASFLPDLIQTSGANREERAVLHRDINELRQKHDQILAKNSARETKVKELKQRHDNYFLPTDTRDKCLVLGSSLVKDFDEEQLHETEVRCMRGAKISDLTKEIEAPKEKSASELGAEFLRNDNIFFSRDHEVNDGYMLDTVHLNMKGSNKLAKSMGLISKNKNDYHA